MTSTYDLLFAIDDVESIRRRISAASDRADHAEVLRLAKLLGAACSRALTLASRLPARVPAQSVKVDREHIAECREQERAAWETWRSWDALLIEDPRCHDVHQGWSVASRAHALALFRLKLARGDDLCPHGQTSEGAPVCWLRSAGVGDDMLAV